MLDNFNTDYPRYLLGIRAGAELYEAESLVDSDLFPAAALGTVLKRYNGTTWEVVQLKRYNGSSWVNAEIKRYNSSTWE